MPTISVADPGFDLRGGAWTLSTAEGGGFRKLLKVLKVEVKVIFNVFLVVFILKLCLELIASEEKIEKK